VHAFRLFKVIKEREKIKREAKRNDPFQDSLNKISASYRIRRLFIPPVLLLVYNATAKAMANTMRIVAMMALAM
jgi:hypothetical protein